MTREPPHGFGAVVIGLGSEDRGDDAVGAVVARAVAGLRLPGVTLVEHEDPTALLDLWKGHDLVVVVDAVCSGSPPGTIHWLETGPDSGPLTERAWTSTGRGGTHAIGLAEVVELARVLGRLPARVVLVGVEAAGFDHGEPLSPPVAAAVDAAVVRIRDAFHTITNEVGADVPR